MLKKRTPFCSVDLPLLKQYCYRCRNPEIIRKTQRKYAIPSGIKYVLGSGEWPDQNLVFAVDGFAGLINKYAFPDLYFVVSGLCHDKQWFLLRDRVADLEAVQYKLVRIGPVNKEDLAPLMGGAFAYVYTSLRCDDCLPILEALTCGCPIIYSDAPIFETLVGDAGIRIKATEKEDLIRAYYALYTDKNLRRTCIRKGLQRAHDLMELARQVEHETSIRRSVSKARKQP